MEKMKTHQEPNEFFQKECRILLEENILLKWQRFSYEKYMHYKKAELRGTFVIDPDYFKHFLSMEILERAILTLNFITRGAATRCVL